MKVWSTNNTDGFLEAKNQMLPEPSLESQSTPTAPAAWVDNMLDPL
jgi:hypothetical protein